METRVSILAPQRRFKEGGSWRAPTPLPLPQKAVSGALRSRYAP